MKKKKATGNGLSKKIKGYVAGGNIFNETNTKDPNYRKYKSGFGASLADIGLTTGDAILSPIAPDIIKSSDYQTKFGATTANKVTHGLGQVANDVATGVIGAIFPAIGAAGGALTSQTQKIGGRDKAITDKQLQQEDVIGGLGKIAGSLVGGLAKKSADKKNVGQDASNAVDSNSVNVANQFMNTVGAQQTNVPPVISEASIPVSTPIGTDYSTYDTSKFSPEQQTAWAGAKDSASKGALLKQWGMKNGGYVEGMQKGGTIHIKKANIGKFDATKRSTGKTTEELTHSDNPVTKKRAIFAQNFGHKEGGTVSKGKAKEILKDGTAHGHPLTQKQKGLFGFIAGGGIPHKADGGKIVGAGTAKSDSIKAKPEDGSFIVPAVNARVAEQLRAKYLGGNKNQIATLRKSGGVDTMLSNGEHMFSKAEADTLRANGIDLDTLAPHASPPPSTVIKQTANENTVQQKADGGLLKKLKEQNAGLQTFDPNQPTLNQPSVTYPDTLPTTDVPATTNPLAAPKTGGGLLNNFDVEKAASLAQLGLGIGSLIGDGKRPVDTLDSDYVAATRKAQQEANYGLSPQERATAELNIERNRRAGIAGVIGQSGGDAGVALANIGAANREANDASNNLSTLSEQLRQQKVGAYNNMVGHKAEMSRRLFDDKMNAFNINQQAGAGLVGAGINNLIGSKRYDKELASQKEISGIGKAVAPTYTPYTMDEINSRYKALDSDTKKKYGTTKAWADSLGLYYK